MIGRAISVYVVSISVIQADVETISIRRKPKERIDFDLGSVVASRRSEALGYNTLFNNLIEDIGVLPHFYTVCRAPS